MSSKDWSVGQIYGMGPTTDATGQPVINGTSFGVELIGHSRRLHIEVAVTSVAHSQLEALGFSDKDAGEIFHKGNRIASHLRSRRRGKPSPRTSTAPRVIKPIWSGRRRGW